MRRLQKGGIVFFGVRPQTLLPATQRPCALNIAHPDVAGLFAVTRSVDNECEHVRQFARFEHVAAQGKRLWLARCAPRDAVTPLVMGHFARRFGSEPFVLLDETHGETGNLGRSRLAARQSKRSVDRRRPARSRRR